MHWQDLWFQEERRIQEITRVRKGCEIIVIILNTKATPTLSISSPTLNSHCVIAWRSSLFNSISCSFLPTVRKTSFYKQSPSPCHVTHVSNAVSCRGVIKCFAAPSARLPSTAVRVARLFHGDIICICVCSIELRRCVYI